MNGLVTPSATRCGRKPITGNSAAKGVDHHGAVRALAFKWIRMLFRCWKERTAYDERRYLVALARRGSPLAAVAAIAKNRLNCFRIASLRPLARTTARSRGGSSSLTGVLQGLSSDQP